jgi:hypothetical protein
LEGGVTNPHSISLPFSLRFLIALSSQLLVRHE